jgi:hypothetical protein
MTKDDVKTLGDNLNDKGWVNVLVKKKKSPEPGKPEYYLEVDVYEKQSNAESTPEPVKQDQVEDDDLPF